ILRADACGVRLLQRLVGQPSSRSSWPHKGRIVCGQVFDANRPRTFNVVGDGSRAVLILPELSDLAVVGDDLLDPAHAKDLQVLVLAADYLDLVPPTRR